MIASAGLLVIGGLVYLKLESLNNIEDNGLSPSESNAAEQEAENTTGSNPIAVGDEIYPSGEYVNVRTSAEVNNGYYNNLLVEIPTPNRIGIVDSIVVADGHTWYNVQMNQDFTNENYGWVRADVVTKNI